EELFRERQLQFIRVAAQNRFLHQLQKVTDPEQKRKIIGAEFIAVFQEEAAKLGDIPFLAQGTIYPDIVESGTPDQVAVKSHHNVGGLPASMSFSALIEPLAKLYKDDVRLLGEILGLPPKVTHRQPFPGPGLAVRILGEVTAAKLNILRQADAIVRQEIEQGDHLPGQYFAILTDLYTTGVKEGQRTYHPVVAVRAIDSRDFMTGSYSPLDHNLLGRISRRITGEIPEVSRVVYDITDKPPGTVEWE
ncbi:MAG: GMP synthase (glutamine-hydrolyzing), partial [Symbiobacteriaceae bacterium]|nr:GMP synthase (glutamine-hydrolyzing) [Symbiobacteriaceae bacterium]